MKNLYIFFFLFSSVSVFSQTCIVAVKSHGKILVGAESKVQKIDYSGNKLPSSYDCKIRSNGNFNFAVAGWQGNQSLDIAYKCSLTAKNFNELLGNHHKLFLPILLDILDSIRVINHNLFDTLFKPNKTFADIIYFGVEGNALVLKWIKFANEYDSSKPVSLKAYEAGTKSDTLAIGETTEIYNMNLLENTETWKKGTKKGIIKLIGVSERYHPDHVGGPINIIEVSLKKTRWDKKPPCY